MYSEKNQERKAYQEINHCISLQFSLSVNSVQLEEKQIQRKLPWLPSDLDELQGMEPFSFMTFSQVQKHILELPSIYSIKFSVLPEKHSSWAFRNSADYGCKSSRERTLPQDENL